MTDGDPEDERTVTSADTAVPSTPRRPRRSRLGALATFAELSDEILSAIEAATVERRFAAGEHLMRQGEPGDCLMILRRGEVEVRVTSEGQSHVLKRTGPGEVFGEMALLTREPRTADVVACTPVRVRSLPVDEFDRLARREPALGEVLSRLTALRLGRETYDALSGKIFHGFTIRRRLGRGGMAVVYEALEQATGRRVALKMMSHRLVFDDDAKQRFQEEADLVESFDHENVARMFGRFEAFRTFFIVMEYCDGAPLDRILRERGALAQPIARRILGQVARALEYAHGRRIVHRDLKPSNVMIDRDGIVKLMDFGLARPVPERGAGGTVAVAGTPPYIAPEQLAGWPCGTATDLYGLAGLAWEMLTGKRLFSARDFDGLRWEHRRWRVPPPETAVPEIADDLREFLAGCLVPDPERRKADLGTIATWAGPVFPSDVGTT